MRRFPTRRARRALRRDTESRMRWSARMGSWLSMARLLTWIALAAGMAAFAPSAEAKTLRFAFQGELKSVDPYQINESFSLTVNGSVYEGLIRRGPDLKIEPCLATSWEVLDPLHWRFHLRKGVKFHEGQDFTADDVVFSVHRVLSAGSNLKGRMPV